MKVINFLKSMNYDRLIKSVVVILILNIIALITAIIMHKNTLQGVIVLICTLLISGPTSAIAFWRIKRERGNDNV